MTKTDSITIQVRLTPKAARNGLQGWATDADGRPVLKASVTVVPEKGKANKALVALLAKEWGLAKSQIEITGGETSRNKTLRLSGAIGHLAGKLPPRT